ncbi:hotdog fold domain-containing protein [Arenimonas sp.]|jgi:acyl-coenzyme A thioesterase PaaI-like protein|uniref:hotdog fold domain-containing protein n=1 Tax=Arenimonas sp. TaxID=1872635 RepID=UPI0037BE9E4B
MQTPLLALYGKISQWPFGHWFFSKAVCFKAPYFGSISPVITRLEYSRCEAVIKDRRVVHNHIGSVHAIALCNLAELCAGVMTDASLPKDMRWIPKGMTVSYLKRAKGRMHATATPMIPIISTDAGYDLPVNVDVLDSDGDKVFHAEIQMWMSPRK